ncbi:MAG: hypothetical protein NTW87_11410 [Planctomycetota bacterium]|nr:hypothetical protein [Planctomycetota bacterium]
MRTIVSGVTVVAVIAALWWNWARVEAWAENTKHEWAKEQDRQRVRNAEVFLEKGLAELDQEIARLECARYEHRVSAEEASLRACKQQSGVVEAEQLAVEFLQAQQAARRQPFEFYGRTYDPSQAEKQFDYFAREALARRQALDELHYDEVAHRQSSKYVAKAVTTLRDARDTAQREGQRLIVDRDVADARALAHALTDPAPGEKDVQPGADLARTLKLLRDHLLRRNAEDRVSAQDGPASIEDTKRRKRELQKADELKQLKDELRKRAGAIRP